MKTKMHLHLKFIHIHLRFSRNQVNFRQVRCQKKTSREKSYSVINIPKIILR